MDFQDSPLLSDEMSDTDSKDEEKNENYSKEINILHNEIIGDLRKLDSKNTGKVSEKNRLNYLQSKIPSKRNLNNYLFQQLYQELERDEKNDIYLEDFVKKYIQVHEELKLNFDLLKKGFDKERKLKDSLDKKNKIIKK